MSHTPSQNPNDNPDFLRSQIANSIRREEWRHALNLAEHLRKIIRDDLDRVERQIGLISGQVYGTPKT